jgi:cell division septal protein FtsQ
MFNKNQKLDPKVRFQRQNFQQKLDQARTYKRASKTFPTGSGEAFLIKIGLGSWISRIIVVLILGCVVWIIYVPNFLYIKKIQISGLNSTQTIAAEQKVNDYFNINKIWPQKNLLILSKNRLGNYLLREDSDILYVDSVKKKLPNTLQLNLIPRFNQFVLQTAGGLYALSNDGKVAAQLTESDLQSTSSPYSNLIKITVAKEQNTLEIGQNYLSLNLVDTLNTLIVKIPETLKTNVQSFEMQTPDDLNLNVQLTSGYKLILDTKSDLSGIWQKLGVLFSNISPQDQSKLFYVNMTIPERAYVCFKGQPCTQPSRINNSTTTTSTLNSTLNINP